MNCQIPTFFYCFQSNFDILVSNEKLCIYKINVLLLLSCPITPRMDSAQHFPCKWNGGEVTSYITSCTLSALCLFLSLHLPQAPTTPPPLYFLPYLYPLFQMTCFIAGVPPTVAVIDWRVRDPCPELFLLRWGCKLCILLDCFPWLYYWEAKKSSLSGFPAEWSRQKCLAWHLSIWFACMLCVPLQVCGL